MFFALASAPALVTAMGSCAGVGVGIGILAGVRPASGADVTPSVEAGAFEGLGAGAMELDGTLAGSDASCAVAKEPQALNNNKRIDSSGNPRNPTNRFAVFIAFSC